MLAVDILFSVALMFTAAWLFLRPFPLPLTAYFVAQFCSIPLLWIAKYAARDGDQSLAYLFVYVATLLPILRAIFSIVLESLKSRKHRQVAAACGILLACIFTAKTYSGIPHPLAPGQWVLLLEAGALVWATMLLGAMAPRIGMMQVAGALAALWGAQAFFIYAGLLHWPRLQGASWIVMPLLALAAWWFIEWRMRALRPAMPRQTRPGSVSPA